MASRLFIASCFLLLLGLVGLLSLNGQTLPVSQSRTQFVDHSPNTLKQSIQQERHAELLSSNTRAALSLTQEFSNSDKVEPSLFDAGLHAHVASARFDSPSSLPSSSKFEQFHLCDSSKFPVEWASRIVKTHKFTRRGLEMHYIDLMVEAKRNPTMNFLEIGTGLGRVILELQSAFPACQCTGTNYNSAEWGQRFPQARNPMDLLAVATQFNISLACDAGEIPRLPSLLSLNVGIQSSKFDLYLPRHHFDIVLSLHALNNKFDPKFTQFTVLRILRVLKATNSFAHVHFASVTSESPSYSTLCLTDRPQLLWSRTLQVGNQDNFVFVYTHERHNHCAVFFLWARTFLPTQFEFLQKLHLRKLTAREFGGDANSESGRHLLEYWARIENMLKHLDQWSADTSVLSAL